jgi:hypothetical protein
MERLESDLRYFKLLLETTTDQVQRNLILREIQNVERQIVRLVCEEQKQLEADRSNMQKAIDKLTALKHLKDCNS